MHCYHLSLGTFCDNGCQATFDNYKVSYHNKQGLWAINLHTNTSAIHEPTPLLICNVAIVTSY
jgi:hypothetical protein